MSAPGGPQLEGQTVVVIGGSAGIGLATAQRARAEGAEVILAGRNPERLAQAAAEVDARSTASFDAEDPAAVEGFFADLEGRSTRSWSPRALPTTRRWRRSTSKRRAALSPPIRC